MEQRNSTVLMPRAGGGLPLEDRVIATRALSILFICLVDVVCGLRLYLRTFVLKSFGLDDGLVIIALVLVNVWGAMSIIITYYGLGNHQKDVPPEDLQVFMKIQYAANVGYLWVALAVKASLVTFIMRVFPNRALHITGHILNGFMVIFTIANCITFVLQCRPIPQFWLRTIPDACFTPDVTYDITLYQGIVMFICDLIILGMPMPIIWRLTMSLKKRMLAMFLFSFGIVACVAALVRFSTLHYAKDSMDQTYSAAISLIWMIIEFNCGLLAGSISSLRQLVRVASILSNSNDDSNHTPHKYTIRNIKEDDFEMNTTTYSCNDRTILQTHETKVSYESAPLRDCSRERIVSEYDVEYAEGLQRTSR